MKTITLTLMLTVVLSVSAFAQKTKSNKSDANKSLAELAAERRTRPLAELSADEHQLMFYEREILRLFKAKKFDKAFSYLTEDAMVNPPNMEAIFGRENQKQMFKELLSIEGVKFTWEPIEAFVGPAKEMGYVYGLVKWKMPNAPEQLGKYISIYVKEEGKWMNKVEIRNTIR